MKLDLSPEESILVTDALNSVVDRCEVEGIDEKVDSDREVAEGLISKIAASRLGESHRHSRTTKR